MSNMIKVKVGQAGAATQEVEVPAGSKVDAALGAAGMSRGMLDGFFSRTTVRINNVALRRGQVLQDGDVVLLVKPVKGG